MQTVRAIAVGMVLVAGAGSSMPGAAQALPDPVYSATAVLTDTAQGTSSTLSYLDKFGGSGLLGGLLDATSVPVPSLFVTAAASTLQSADVDAKLTYAFEILGPAVGTPIPIDVAGTVQVTVAGAVSAPAFSTSFFTEASFSVNNAPGLVVGCSTADFACDPSGFSGVTHFSVTSGALNQIFVHTQSSVANFLPDASTTVTAFADPIISFGAGFDATGYSIVLSPGIGNGVAAVPEPSAQSLFGAGLLLVLLNVAWGGRRAGRVR